MLFPLAGSAFHPPEINFLLVNGDGIGTVHCENISLLHGLMGTTDQYNVTLHLLTPDIAVYLEKPTAIIVVFNPGIVVMRNVTMY